MIEKTDKKKKRKRILLLVLLTMIFTAVCPQRYLTVEASSVSELKKKQEETKKEIEKLQEQKKELESSYGKLNSDLANANAELEEVAAEIELIQLEIEQTTELLAEMQKVADKQYADMKLRIQYIYEKGQETFLDIICSSKSVGEVLNRVEYASELTQYDRQLMVDYQQNLADIAAYKAELDEKNATLLAKQESLKTKQDAISNKIAEVAANMKAQSETQNKKEEESADLAKKIKAMEEYERKLEEERARREKERLEQLKKENQELQNSGGAGKPVTPAEGEEYLLAHIIYCEAGNQSYEGQLAVASVVINRVNSNRYPNTITEVVYQPSQFSPAQSGRLALAMENSQATQSCYQAAREAMAGNTNVDYLHFRVNNGSIDGYVIGDHVFY